MRCSKTAHGGEPSETPAPHNLAAGISGCRREAFKVVLSRKHGQVGLRRLKPADDAPSKV
jgi:hypothetical protein